MNLAEEVLSSLSSADISTYSANSETEPHIVIGNDRTIAVPESLKRIAVQYDHNVETVTFDCPRYWDGLDMSTMKVHINYMLPNRALGSYVADNVEIDKIDNSIMHFAWTVSRNVTMFEGDISFLVCIKKVDSDGNEENHWNSELNQEMHVSKGLEVDKIIEEKYADIITQLLTRMDHILESGSTALDTSLTETGLAADAGAVGKAIKNLSSNLSTIDTNVANITEQLVNMSNDIATANTNIENLNVYRNCITPQMYGAVGDGVADDTTAIQAAVTYITTNGGILRFPGNHIYMISEPIRIVTGSKSFEIDFGFSIISCSSALKTTTIEGQAVNAAFHVYTKTAKQKRIATIKNLIIDGNNESIHTGLYLQPSSKVYYENINIINVRRGIYYKQGVESFFNNIYMFRDSTLDIKDEINVESTDCIGIDCYATDSHFSNIVPIDFVVGIKMNAGSGDNRVYGAHVWNYYSTAQYIKSVCFMNAGSNFYTNCVADHFYVGWYIAGPGSLYLANCNIVCGAVKQSGTIIPLDSYAFYFGDSNSKNRTGSDIIVNGTRINGELNDYEENVNLTFSNISDCNINYSGITQNCAGVPDPNIPVMVAGKTVYDDKNSSQINQYGGIKSIEKTLTVEDCSTNFLDMEVKTYASGTWVSDYLQVTNGTSVAVFGDENEKMAKILPASGASGYNYLKLYLSKLKNIKNNDLIMIAYAYKTDGNKVVYGANAEPFTNHDAETKLTGDGKWHTAYTFFTVKDTSSLYVGFGDGASVDSNALYLSNIRVINLSKYSIPRYYLETNNAYRARLISLFGTAYETSVTIPARTDISFMSIPYKFNCLDVSSESDQMIGFSASGKPIILTRTSDYSFSYIYTNNTASNVVFELSKYTLDKSGNADSDTKKIEAYIDNKKIYISSNNASGLYNWSYTRNVVVPSGSTLKLVFTIPSGEECKFSKLVISPYGAINSAVVDSTGSYAKIPLYANGEICLVAKNQSGASLPTAYFEVRYSKPYHTVEEFDSLARRISALEAANT